MNFQTTTYKKLIKLFFAFYIIVTAILSQTNFVSESHDSRFYSEQVVHYQHANFEQLLTPKWNDGSYGFDPNSYMRDQFPGQLLMGVLVTYLGIPAKHALHSLQMLFQLASIFLLVEIAKKFISEEDSLFIFIGLLLFPFAFSYNIRGNHESGIAFFSFLSLYAGLNLREHKKFILLSIIASFFLLIIKGPFVIFGLLLTTLGFLFSFENLTDLKNNFFKKTPLFTIMLNNLLIIGISILTLIWFENKFLSITQTSFLEEFYRIQFKQRALDLTNTHPVLIQKLLNFWYYFNHALTYSLPWGLFALIATIKKLVKKEKIEFYQTKLSMLILSGVFIYCGVFSLSNRLAGRYNHPAYYLFATWSLLYCYFNIEFLNNFHKKNGHSLWYPYFITGLWLMAFFVHFI